MTLPIILDVAKMIARPTQPASETTVAMKMTTVTQQIRAPTMIARTTVLASNLR